LDARRITVAEMKYMRRTAGYIWTDYKTSTQIAQELKITQILDKLLEYGGEGVIDGNMFVLSLFASFVRNISYCGKKPTRYCHK
jgi:hypothetical protein